MRQKYANITLIGMSGAGKSMSGRALAYKLQYKFIDVDEVIKSKNGLPLRKIIEKFGEEKFKEIEEEAVLNLGDIENCVISTGGSVIYSEKAMGFLKQISLVIFLDIPFEIIENRLTNKDMNERGIIGLKGKTLKQLFEERNAIYKKYADITVNADDSEELLKIIKKS